MIETPFDIYLVGGAVRDEIMGRPIKDNDFTCECKSFDEMYDFVNNISERIYDIPNAEFNLCLRARFHKEPFLLNGQSYTGDLDFACCRKEVGYSDGRHPDVVTIGTLKEDLSRRDFCMNAIARVPGTKRYIDPYHGRRDIKNELIRCVGDPNIRFQEDALRIVRALRFSVTLGFNIDIATNAAMGDLANLKRLSGVSIDRRRDELQKMFKADTILALEALNHHNDLMWSLFDDTDLWLNPTNKKR